MVSRLVHLRPDAQLERFTSFFSMRWMSIFPRASASLVAPSIASDISGGISPFHRLLAVWVHGVPSAETGAVFTNVDPLRQKLPKLGNGKGGIVIKKTVRQPKNPTFASGLLGYFRF